MSLLAPTSNLVTPLCNDLYQITMAYGYWKANKHDETAVFEAYFRKNPFKGEYCIFAGADELLAHLNSFKFQPEDIEYLKTLLPHCEDGFWAYLEAMDCSEVKVWSVRQGEIVFPRVPLVVLEGPLAVVQILETTILNLINFASLVATNARRMRTAGEQPTKPRLLSDAPPPQFLEFGLRRAQGPDGGFSASKYSCIGGFHGTSNVIAGQKTGLPVVGTTAHSFVTSFHGIDDIKKAPYIGIKMKSGETVNFTPFIIAAQEKVLEVFEGTNNQNELMAFSSFAAAFPHKFIALVDSYNTIKSGVINFLIVGLALQSLQYAPIGIRLDSGDLARLSIECRKMFITMDTAIKTDIFRRCSITVSNDINEANLLQFAQDGHEIDVFAVGTNLVTCQKQPALGCVYKLVEIGGEARIKLSEEVEKTTMPFRKKAYRLYGNTGQPLADLIARGTEAVPKEGHKVLCRNPVNETDRVFIVPSKVKELHVLLWKGKRCASVVGEDDGVEKEVEIRHLPSVLESQAYCQETFSSMPCQHTRPISPSIYRVAVSEELYFKFHDLIQDNMPISQIS